MGFSEKAARGNARLSKDVRYRLFTSNGLQVHNAFQVETVGRRFKHSFFGRGFSRHTH